MEKHFSERIVHFCKNIFVEIVHVYLLEKQQQWELTNQKKKTTQNFHTKCLMVGFLYYNINYVLSFILLLFFFDSLNWILFFSSRSFYDKKRNLRNKLWDAGEDNREGGKSPKTDLCVVLFSTPVAVGMSVWASYTLSGLSPNEMQLPPVKSLPIRQR